MIGIVVVSHSPALAQAAVSLALEVAGERSPAVRVAAGAAGGVTGTDAAAIAEAIDEIATPDGVLVVMDLGSALLSTEMALEFTTTDVPVRLSAAPFVEGLIAAVVGAASGSSLDAVDADARRALEPKTTQLGDAPAPDASPAGGGEAPAEGDGEQVASFEADIRNPSGLHARPAATFARTAACFEAEVTITDLRAGHGPAPTNLIALMALGITQGTRVRVEARGPDAEDAAQALKALIDDGFGER
ncbi:HPr family phosphocarrier protein [Microbacterium sp. gxy059]|uniref:HPr family phosphocarrier protein n=1 Tax=Microbacterium sp. gxy059 TaxID=2957199 RepID=UPI003D99A0AD